MIEFKIIEELDDEAIIGNKDLCQLENIHYVPETLTTPFNLQ